jgi:hypothetical protein
VDVACLSVEEDPVVDAGGSEAVFLDEGAGIAGLEASEGCAEVVVEELGVFGSLVEQVTSCDVPYGDNITCLPEGDRSPAHFF